MKWFNKASEIRHNSDPAKAEISLSKIILGEFIDIEKPTFGQLLHSMTAQVQERLRKGG